MKPVESGDNGDRMPGGEAPLMAAVQVAQPLVGGAAATATDPLDLRQTFHRAVRAAVFLAVHTLVASILIGAISIVHKLLLLAGDPHLFGLIPVRYAFDIMDLAILLVFLPAGVSDARRAFRE